jgi:hypothetical protein
MTRRTNIERYLEVLKSSLKGKQFADAMIEHGLPFPSKRGYCDFVLLQDNLSLEEADAWEDDNGQLALNERIHQEVIPELAERVSALLQNHDVRPDIGGWRTVALRLANANSDALRVSTPANRRRSGGRPRAGVEHLRWFLAVRRELGTLPNEAAHGDISDAIDTVIRKARKEKWTGRIPTRKTLQNLISRVPTELDPFKVIDELEEERFWYMVTDTLLEEAARIVERESENPEN